MKKINIVYLEKGNNLLKKLIDEEVLALFDYPEI